MIQVAGMVVDPAADLKSVAKQEGSELCDQFLPGVAGFAEAFEVHDAITLEACLMTCGVNGFMCPGGVQAVGRPEGISWRHGDGVSCW